MMSAGTNTSAIRTVEWGGYSYDFIGDDDSIRAEVYKIENEVRKKINDVANANIKLTFQFDEEYIVNYCPPNPNWIKLSDLTYEKCFGAIRLPIQEIHYDSTNKSINILFQKNAYNNEGYPLEIEPNQ